LLINKILVAFDGSERSRRALKVGIELASKLHRPIHTVTVVESLPNYISVQAYAPLDDQVVAQIVEQRDAHAKGLLDEVQSLAAQANIEITSEAVTGDEVGAIVEAVQKQQADLLIVGLRSHPGLLERFAPNTGKSLAEKSPCSILGVR